MRQRRAVSLALGGLLCLSACASDSKPKPRPAPPDPAEQTVAATTELLKLDALQQQKMRQLLKELADRYDAIQAGWAKGKKVDPNELRASQATFENDFAAILTPQQMALFRQTRIRLQIQAKLGGHT